MTRTTLGPSTAERMRSASARAADAVLAVAGSDPAVTSMHHLCADGTAVVAAPTDCVAAALAWQAGPGGLPAVLELTDFAPLDLREPVRSLVWLRGTLTAVSGLGERRLADLVAAENPHPALLDVGHGATLLRLRLESAVVADSSGAEAVAVADLLAAEPDPFRDVETDWLQHLEEDHSDLVEMLARRLPSSLRTGRIRPLGIDRYGVRLRIEAEDGDRDVRMDFAEPVADALGLSRALRILVGCPFVNGMRARR
ncbi:DUF2470 domain-containing protein [Rhodococcus sp. SGAir0479]|uniref:DUF2470 domain-containing protein n=1 Tax=Rhodococcus sp. SGAir0479 TaxID=2567884 RepID=UPI0010CCF236|nr:DUF2470 domain-containing protein [Rhodococcus sp. SGAir0479]QCQ93166.1 DUF2470 domain-containing protein [Rhodococcus sp. SGAir0479]